MHSDLLSDTVNLCTVFQLSPSPTHAGFAITSVGVNLGPAASFGLWMISQSH